MMNLNQNEQHLKLLSIFHYIVGGLTAFFSCFALIHLVLGIVIIVAPDSLDSGDPPPPFLGWLFALIGGSIILFGWTLAGFVIASGRFLVRRKHYMFCMVIAGIECMVMPFGTVLGVFTIVVLMQPAVKEMFETGANQLTP